LSGGSTGRRALGRTRSCAVTRRVLPECDLIRFVAAPDGSIIPDLKAKLPGRGIWVALGRPLVAEAAKRNVFSRGLKVDARPAADLPEQVAGRLREAALGRLGLARKARAALCGFTKVEMALEKQNVAGLLIAADAAEDGCRKMEQALYRRTVRPPVFRCFEAAELGLAMGRPNVIHAAVLQSPAGRSFVEAATRLQRYDGAGGLADEGSAEPQG
jgi:predicted RNA-binding protein YlxR (DUF448 family)